MVLATVSQVFSMLDPWVGRNILDQYLTKFESTVFYYGKAGTFSNDSATKFFVYFLSKAINNGPNQNGAENYIFNDFQSSSFHVLGLCFI